MAPAPARDLKTGTIINKTLDVLEKNVVIAVVMAVVLAAINIGLGYLGLSRTEILQQVGLGLAGAVVSIFFGFVIYTLMLRRLGWSKADTGDILVPYIGMSILYTLGVTLGLFALVIPGLFVMARWSVAQPLMLAQGTGVMESLSKSWDMTKGNEFAIILAALALAIVFVAAAMFAPLYFGPESVTGLVIGQIATAASSVIMAAMGVALYGLVIKGRDVSEVFS